MYVIEGEGGNKKLSVYSDLREKWMRLLLIAQNDCEHNKTKPSPTDFSAQKETRY